MGRRYSYLSNEEMIMVHGAFGVRMRATMHVLAVCRFNERTIVHISERRLHSSANQTYAVDRWVVRFLLEHALAFPFNKNPVGDDSCTMLNTTPPNETINISLERRNMLEETLGKLHA